MLEKTHRREKTSLVTLFFTFSLDTLSATIIYPIFAPLFLNPQNGILAADVSDTVRATLLGLFLGAFPFAQFLLAPVLGEYADRSGRKKALLITTILTFIGYVLSAASIQLHYLSLLFVGRLIMGIGAANFTVCLAALSDLSPNEKKHSHYLSLGSMLAGHTFILGPFVGGKLSDPTVNPIFNPAFPIWIGSTLSLINILFIIFAFKETLITTIRNKFDLLKSFHNIQLAFRIKQAKILYTLFFFYFFSWNLLYQFIPAYLVQNFRISNSAIGDMSALMGVFWVVGTGCIYRLLKGRISLKKILFFSLLGFAIFSFCIAIKAGFWGSIGFFGVAVVFAGIIWPASMAELSQLAEAHIHGKIFGLTQSIQSLTMMLAPILGGFFLAFHSFVPFIMASIGSLIAMLVLFKYK